MLSDDEALISTNSSPEETSKKRKLNIINGQFINFIIFINRITFIQYNF